MLQVIPHQPQAGQDQAADAPWLAAGQVDSHHHAKGVAHEIEFVQAGTVGILQGQGRQPLGGERVLPGRGVAMSREVKGMHLPQIRQGGQRLLPVIGGAPPAVNEDQGAATPAPTIRHRATGKIDRLGGKGYCHRNKVRIEVEGRSKRRGWHSAWPPQPMAPAHWPVFIRSAPDGAPRPTTGKQATTGTCRESRRAAGETSSRIWGCAERGFFTRSQCSASCAARCPAPGAPGPAA